ncbi:MAG: GNAT family N-acetyltransferase [Armatimonadetes bacterium]|nr:GNAT family N-acetyltransferase [Armatimonadota bacterium]
MRSVLTEFRAIDAKDEGLLREFCYLALYVEPGAAPFPPEFVDMPEIARYWMGWGADGDLGVFAVRNGRAIGAAWLRTLQGDARGYGWVSDEIPELSLSLLPAFRGRGIGSKLLAELLGIADMRFGGISLSVSKNNPAVRLYERFEFETVGGDGSSLIMLRRR